MRSAFQRANACMYVVTTAAALVGCSDMPNEGVQEVSSALSVFAANVNFQVAESATPAGYLADVGEVYAQRGGHAYGWNADNRMNARERSASNSPDVRYDTFNQLQRANNPNARWELAVPNGSYSVRVVAGDPQKYDGTYRIDVEGVRVLSFAPSRGSRWGDATATVNVSDGKLTIGNGAGARNNKISFIEVRGVNAAPAPTPTTPTPPPTPPPAPTGNLRPTYNTSTGFFALNGKIYDPTSQPIVFRGVNVTHFWGAGGEAAIPEIGLTHANSARAVFGPGGEASTPADRERIVRAYIAQGITPIVEYHNDTCGSSPSSITVDATNFWLGEARWLKALERNVIVNISNEWGNNDAAWRDAYISSIAKLRANGVNNMFVVDAGGNCGQNAQSIETYGKAIEAADPQHNVAFSVHLYGFWVDPGSPLAGTWDGRQPYDVDAELGTLVATGLPIIVGEFSSDLWTDNNYRTAPALAAFEKHGVSWLGWMWKNNTDSASPVDMTTNNRASSLTVFGKQLEALFVKNRKSY